MMRTNRSRPGLSILEFIGCMSAMVGGVLLGSIYLGVDVKQATVAALKHANLVAAEPATEAKTAEAPAATSTASPAPAKAAAPSPLDPIVANAANVSPARQVPSNPESAPPAPTTAPASPVDEPAVEAAEATESSNPLANFLSRDDLIDLTDEQRVKLTRAYWEALDQCMKEEVKHRHTGMPEDGNWQLFDYLSCRKQGHEQAASFVSQLHLRGVDGHVSSYAKKALAWHRDGVKLFGRALDLLTDAPTAQLSGPFAQSWQSAATQHQMEERLLGEKHTAVQAYLNHSLTDSAATAASAPLSQATSTDSTTTATP